MKCAGRTLASKASGILTDVWIETYRLPPILEREPGRDRGLSGKQTVSRAACDSGSPRSASLGRSSQRGTGLQSPEVGCNSLLARQFIQVWVAGTPAAL